MKVDYRVYKGLRDMGLRAVIAFGIAKYGFQFLANLIIEEEFQNVQNTPK